MYLFPDESTIEGKLQAPFPESEIEWRAQRCGATQAGNPYVFVLAYVSARAVQRRLDDVFGWAGWHVEYRQERSGIICRLKTFNEHGEVVKEDGSPETDIEAFKGGISGALKRVAASGYGIGRYLYYLDATFAPEVSTSFVKGWERARTPKTDRKMPDTEIFWLPPTLPKWALPKEKK